LAACLAAFTLGCRSMLDIPESAKARGYDPHEQHEDGWLFRRLTGRSAADTPENPPSGVQLAAANAAEGSPSGVRQANFEPVPSPDAPGSAPSDPRNTVVLPAAGDEDKSDENDGFQLSDLAPSNIAKQVKGLFTPAPDEALAKTLYQEGEELYQAGKYSEAAEKFKDAAARWPDSRLEEDSLFMLGESQFFADQYPRANDTYEKLLKKYGYTRHLDKAVARQFAIGRYWEQLDATAPAWLLGFQFSDGSRPKFDTWGYALKAYQSVREHDPTGPLADDSIMATGNAYFLKGRYEEAGYQYDLIRKDYPRSDHQLQAHLLGMKARQMSYQGPLYDGKALDEAGQIAEETLVQFYDTLGSERPEVVDFQNKVMEEKALRDWTIAQYYDRRKYYGAARYYYNALLQSYPRTAVAEQAKARLQEIEGLPDHPPNHFKWLTDRFPSTKRE